MKISMFFIVCIFFTWDGSAQSSQFANKTTEFRKITAEDPNLPLDWKYLREHSYGVFIGVETFDDSKISRFDYAVNDAQAMRDAFVNTLGILKPGQAKLLVSGTSTPPLAIPVMEAIDQAAARAGEHGILIIFIASHGVGNDPYMLLQNTPLKHHRKYGLNHHELLALVSQSRCGRCLIILDTHRPDSNFLGQIRFNYKVYKALGELSGTCTLFASKGKSLAYHDKKRKQGLFTSSFLDGLNGNAGLNRWGQITINTLFSFVREQVIKGTEGKQVPAMDAIQCYEDFPLLAHKGFLVSPETEQSRIFVPLLSPEDVAYHKDLVRKQWSDYQLRMESTAEHLFEEFDKESNDQKKADLRTKFLQNFADDNPYSEIDNELRSEMKRQGKMWKSKTDEPNIPKNEWSRIQEQLELEMEMSKVEDAAGERTILLLSGIDKSYPELTIKTRIAALEGLLKDDDFMKNNPFSTKDDEHRCWVKQRLDHWRNLDKAEGRKKKEKHHKNGGWYPGDTKRMMLHGEVEVAFRWCPPGSFMMGSPSTEIDRSDKEKQHNVILTKGFWMGETEVTQEQWAAVMGSGRNRNALKESNLPVEQVSWNDIQEFLRKLNASMFAGKYALPTEAQWEYACRAGADTPFHTGENLTTSEANYNGNFLYAGEKDGVYRQEKMPVRSFAPNRWGLYDMHGNVWELCHDRYKENYYRRSKKKDPKGPFFSQYRVTRGGSWDSIAAYCRSAYRAYNSPDDRNGEIGFRLVLIYR